MNVVAGASKCIQKLAIEFPCLGVSKSRNSHLLNQITSMSVNSNKLENNRNLHYPQISTIDGAAKLLLLSLLSTNFLVLPQYSPGTLLENVECIGTGRGGAHRGGMTTGTGRGTVRGRGGYVSGRGRRLRRF